MGKHAYMLCRSYNFDALRQLLPKDSCCRNTCSRNIKKTNNAGEESVRAKIKVRVRARSLSNCSTFVKHDLKGILKYKGRKLHCDRYTSENEITPLCFTF